jgi:hypothetical protein
MAIALVPLAGSSAQAALLASDDFSYPDGSYLNSQNGGTGFTGQWLSPSFNSRYSGNAPLLIENGQVSFNPAGPSGLGDGWRQNSFRLLPFSFLPGQQYWVSFDLQSLTAGLPTRNFQGVSFYEGGGTERLFVGHSTYLGHDNSWRMVQQPGNIYQTNASTSVSSVDSMKMGVLELVVGSSSSSTIANLWVGPDTVTPVDVSRAPDATATNLMLLNVSYIAVAGDATFLLDNLKVGTAAADVMAIPEPAGLAAMAGGLVLLTLRRQNKTAAGSHQGRGQLHRFACPGGFGRGEPRFARVALTIRLGH